MRTQSRYSRYFTYIKPVARLPLVKTYGMTIFTIIVMAIFILFAIKPTLETILVLYKKLDNFEEALQKVQKKAIDLTEAKKNYENLEITLKSKVQSQIPDSLELKTVIQILEGAVKRHEASISALQIQPITIDVESQSQKMTLSEIGFTFNVEGSYKNLVSILQDLKISSRLITLDKVFINKLTEGAGLIMSISGKAFYLK